MDRTSSETSEEKSPLLLGSPTNCDVECAEVINPGVGKGRRLVCESLLWEVCHDRLNVSEYVLRAITKHVDFEMLEWSGKKISRYSDLS